MNYALTKMLAIGYDWGAVNTVHLIERQKHKGWNFMKNHTLTSTKKFVLSDTKKRIVEVASRLFFEEGYHKVGIRRIAEAVERSSGAIYKHFACKEDILDAVLSDCLSFFEEQDADYLASFKQEIERNKEDLEALRALFFNPRVSKTWTDTFWMYRREFQFIFFDSKGTRYENLSQKLTQSESRRAFECIKIFSDQSSRARALSYEEFEALASGHVACYASAIRGQTDYNRFCKIVETSNWLYSQLFWSFVVPDTLVEKEFKPVNRAFCTVCLEKERSFDEK